MSPNDRRVEIRGERVILRDPLPGDVEARVRWATTEVEWQDWDAPWEGTSICPPEKVPELRARLLAPRKEPLPSPRTALWVQLAGGPLLGWANRYQDDPEDGSTWVGVNICESACWGKGLGSEALRLWIGYLRRELGLRRLRLGTWSGNERMVRCAEKCGFLLVNRRVGAREVRGQSYDALEFELTGGKVEYEQGPVAGS